MSSLYADLRVRGEVIVSWVMGSEVSMARREAKRDGLKVVTTRGSAKHLSRSQARERPITVALVHPDDPTTIIRPDAETGA